MTENNKQDQHPDGAIEATPTTEASQTIKSTEDQSRNVKKSPKNNTQSSSSSTLFISVSLGLSVIALATSGWLYFQSTQSTLDKDVARLASSHTNLDNKLNANTVNKTQFNQLIEQVIQSEAAIQNQKEQLATQQAQQADKLLSLESKLNRMSNTTKEDWKLAETEYLIRLANQRLLLESDSAGAATLLINADDILNELEDPIVFTTRKALAKDIQALKSTSQFDLEGAYLQLNALYDNVATLPQREPSKAWQATITETTNTTPDTSNKILSVLDSFWQSVRSLIVINYNHKPIDALLPPEVYQQLITGLQLQLDVAQVALIKGEPVIYQQALSRIADAVTEHFDTQAKSVVSFLGNLTTLQQLNPAPKLPLPRASLLAIKSLMKDWHNRSGDTLQSDIDFPQQPPVENNATAPQIDSGDEQ
ncbi:heme biosynthesis protein HemY [Marinomonas sp. M1K-6]|uniref:Heme biosynthesis protein HemY n=1 Tax=Marinomonas profundi TaxID=2726122 RepID=A0A847RAF5_9GAMM|nr:uroporphyrinogen-III C-methyltransferase [Marinomonas profundi]NLQ19016.1 heme biosynthesis protein HemY [Marinomonas profundi]UDV02071.1 uroporphyrinogen-III C-methyltransferase [Marinomonas profundi]